MSTQVDITQQVVVRQHLGDEMVAEGMNLGDQTCDDLPVQVITCNCM